MISGRSERSLDLLCCTGDAWAHASHGVDDRALLKAEAERVRAGGVGLGLSRGPLSSLWESRNEDPNLKKSEK